MIDFGLEQSHLMLLGAACLAAMLALPLLAAARRELAKFRGRCSAFTAALLVMCLFGAFVVGGTKTNGVMPELRVESVECKVVEPLRGMELPPQIPALSFQLSTFNFQHSTLSITPAPQVSQKELAVRSWNICGAWDIRS